MIIWTPTAIEIVEEGTDEIVLFCFVQILMFVYIVYISLSHLIATATVFYLYLLCVYK